MVYKAHPIYIWCVSLDEAGTPILVCYAHFFSVKYVCIYVMQGSTQLFYCYINLAAVSIYGNVSYYSR